MTLTKNTREQKLLFNIEFAGKFSVRASTYPVVRVAEPEEYVKLFRAHALMVLQSRPAGRSEPRRTHDASFQLC